MKNEKQNTVQIQGEIQKAMQNVRLKEKQVGRLQEIAASQVPTVPDRNLKAQKVEVNQAEKVALGKNPAVHRIAVVQRNHSYC